MTASIGCNWPKCRTARGLSGCFAWCKCRCHAKKRDGDDRQGGVTTTDQPETTHADPTWCVHILGPDDVLVQPDRATAVREAHALNAWVAGHSNNELNDPMNPTIWAVVTTLEARP